MAVGGVGVVKCDKTFILFLIDVIKRSVPNFKKLSPKIYLNSMGGGRWAWQILKKNCLILI